MAKTNTNDQPRCKRKGCGSLARADGYCAAHKLKGRSPGQNGEAAPAAVPVEDVPLSRIKIDGGTQARVEIDPDAVADYREASADLPPADVFFDGSNYWMGDGFHRFLARKADGAKTLRCRVRPGGRREAILFAAGANDKHGLRRTRADKRNAVAMLVAEFPDEQANWYAVRAKVSHATAAAVLAEVSSQKGEAFPNGNGGQVEEDTPILPPETPTTAEALAEAEAALLNVLDKKIPGHGFGQGEEDDAEPTQDGEHGDAWEPPPDDDEPPVLRTDDEPAPPKKKPAASPRMTNTDRSRDGLGVVIPDAVKDKFGDRWLPDAIDHVRGLLDSLKAESWGRRAVTIGGQLPFLHGPQFAADMEDARIALEAAIAHLTPGLPFCVCPKCQGKPAQTATCADCRFGGYWPRWKAEQEGLVAREEAAHE